MLSRTTRSFRERFARLPRKTQRQAREAYKLFRENSSHPGLRFKQIHPDPPIYSVRIGISYRAVGVVDNDVVVWYWIGTRAEYDKLIDQL